MFDLSSDEFIKETLHKNFMQILSISQMSHAEQTKAKNAKCASPADSVFVNFIVFWKAFHEAESRGILSPAELAMGKELTNAIV